MFNIKQRTKPGQCEAMRCKVFVVPGTTCGDHVLCERHIQEWEAAGRPELSAAITVVEAKAPKAPAATDAIRAEIEPTRANLEQALQVCATLPLDSQDALDWLGEARAVARKALAWLDERRMAVNRPILDAQKANNANFKPSTDLAKAVIDCVDKRLVEFESARKAQQDVALAAVGQGAADEHTLVAAHGGALELPAQVNTRRTLAVRITDANAVPRPFLQLDESLALAYARERGQDACKVPGLEFYYEEHIVSARGVAS